MFTIIQENIGRGVVGLQNQKKLVNVDAHPQAKIKIK